MKKKIGQKNQNIKSVFQKVDNQKTEKIKINTQTIYLVTYTKTYIT